MEENYRFAPQAEGCEKPRPGLLLRGTFNLYRSQFRRWFAITAPTSLLAAVVLWIANQQIATMLRGIPMYELSSHWGVLAGAMVARYGSYFVAWFLGCFALGGIATVVSDLDQDDSEEGAWIHDSHQRTREHFGSLVLAAFVTFCAFLAGMAAAEIVVSAAFRAVRWSRFARFSFGAGLVAYVVVTSIVSWFGMAIPLILRDNAGIWTALKKSVKLSNGYEGALSFLVVQSTAGSFVAWYATHHGLRLLVPNTLQHTSWYGWVVFTVGILASAAVEPPIFIGFSLLADPARFGVPASLPGTQSSADVY